ncbi:hypothetical protein LCGC14_2633940, partial [marine sediment metagenome]
MIQYIVILTLLFSNFLGLVSFDEHYPGTHC